MSYRTYANDVQIFGNGEYYSEWFEFLKSQKIEINEEGCYRGEITDFMGAVTTIEKIVLRLNKEQEERKERFGGKIGRYKIQSLFDFTSNINRVVEQTPDETSGFSVLDKLFDIVNMTYAFMPYVFFQACEEDLETIDAYSTPNHFRCFKLKEGKTIHIEAR